MRTWFDFVCTYKYKLGRACWVVCCDCDVVGDRTAYKCIDGFDMSIPTAYLYPYKFTQAIEFIKVNKLEYFYWLWGHKVRMHVFPVGFFFKFHQTTSVCMEMSSIWENLSRNVIFSNAIDAVAKRNIRRLRTYYSVEKTVVCLHLLCGRLHFLKAFLAQI